MLNFSAPELFDASSNCDQLDVDGYEVQSIQPGAKTAQTDVYAFGCLCYAVSLSIHIVRVMVTRPDILRYRAFSRYTPITSSPACQRWRTSSTIGQSNDG
jgi:hypothetical protein